jgi:hypothetical protein
MENGERRIVNGTLCVVARGRPSSQAVGRATRASPYRQTSAPAHPGKHSDTPQVSPLEKGRPRADRREVIPWRGVESLQHQPLIPLPIYPPCPSLFREGTRDRRFWQGKREPAIPNVLEASNRNLDTPFYGSRVRFCSVGVYFYTVGVDFYRVGVDFSRVGVDFSRVGVDFSRVGVDFSRIGVDFSRIGGGFYSVGLPFYSFGARPKTAGCPFVAGGGPFFAPSVPGFMRRSRSGNHAPPSSIIPPPRRRLPRRCAGRRGRGVR